jgi:hypothetical protein
MGRPRAPAESRRSGLWYPPFNIPTVIADAITVRIDAVWQTLHEPCARVSMAPGYS